MIEKGTSRIAKCNRDWEGNYIGNYTKKSKNIYFCRGSRRKGPQKRRKPSMHAIVRMLLGALRTACTGNNDKQFLQAGAEMAGGLMWSVSSTSMHATHVEGNEIKDRKK